MHTLVGEANTTTALTSQWQPVTVQYTSLDSPPLQLSASMTGAPPGPCFFADDTSIFAQ